MWLRPLTACLLLSGCSFVLVKEPSPSAVRDPNVPLECTRSRSIPAADLAIGAVLATLVFTVTYSAVKSFNADSECVGEGCYIPWKPSTLAAFLVGSPWWISGAVGMSDTGHCRDAYRARMNAR
jgi:hypothetical protein